MRFNPRARVGRDLSLVILRLHLIEFQSTRPRGARLHTQSWIASWRASFNPRARVGRDH